MNIPENVGLYLGLLLLIVTLIALTLFLFFYLKVEQGKHMKEEYKAQWEKIRSIGKWRYILLLGSWMGMFVTILSPIIEYLIFESSFDLISLLIRLPLNLIGGIVFGYLMWKFSENRYNRSK